MGATCGLDKNPSAAPSSREAGTSEPNKPKPKVSSKSARRAEREMLEEEDMLDDLICDEKTKSDIQKTMARQRARRRNQSKRLQYNFLFKTGAFLVMLTIVLITKQIQKWVDPDGAASNKTAVDEPAQGAPA